MADHNDPSNSAVKPSIETLEGKIYLAVALLTAVSAALGTVLSAYPDSKEVKLAALVVSVLMASVSAFTVQRFGRQRTDVKQTANVVAGGLAAIDKALAVAKDNPDLAAAIIRSAGVRVPVEPAPK